MTKHLRRKAAPAFLALLCLLPCFAAAQTRTEEEIDRGRFGAEEPEEPGTAPAETGLDAKWLRLGVRAGPSFRFYTPREDTPYTGGDTTGISVETGVQVNVQILSFLSVQGEAVFTWDNASVWAYRSGTGSEFRYTNDYSAFFFQFPLVVKFDFYPGRFKISPFFGAYFLTPLGKLGVSNSLNGDRQSLSYGVFPPAGLLGGLSGALNLGPGAVIADIRYAADLGGLEAREGTIQQFRRSMTSVTLGYELGFFAKKRGKP
jgi:hypothetical protein